MSWIILYPALFYFFILCKFFSMKSLALSVLLLTLVFAGPLHAQNRKMTTNSPANTYPKQKEVFYVLADDLTKKDGAYQYFRADKLIISGYYKNDQKDSLWEYYNFNTALISRKRYVQGKKTGKWEFFTPGGEPDWSYDFNTNTVAWLKSQPSDTATFLYLTDGGVWERARLDKAPLALNSQQEWLSYLNRTFRYPNEAIDKHQQGVVVVYITVDENGNPSDYSISEGNVPVLNEEALRVIKAFHHEFIPAEKNRKKIKSQYRTSVTFRLEN